MDLELTIKGGYSERPYLRLTYDELTKLFENMGTLVLHESSLLDDRSESPHYFSDKRELVYIFPQQDVALIEEKSDKTEERDYIKQDQKKKYKYNELNVGGRISLQYREANFSTEVAIIKQGGLFPENLKKKLEELINL